MGYRTRVVAVNLNWNDDEWNFNANSLDDNTWNEGNLFLSFETGDMCKARLALAGRALFWVSHFFIHLIFPTPENFAYFLDFF